MMRGLAPVLWGSGRGPIKRLAPHTRLLTGVLTLTACLLVPASTAAGSCGVLLLVVAWTFACRPPARALGALISLGLGVALPYFLLTPWISGARATDPQSWVAAATIPWTLWVRGMSGMLVSMATVSSLSASHLREALARLPLPLLVSEILLQIVQQMGNLVEETRRVAAAMAVRGASSGGVAAWRMLASLPRAWLPRVILRAERVGDAMELRGYGVGAAQPSFPTELRLADYATLSVAWLVAGAALALRIQGGLE